MANIFVAMPLYGMYSQDPSNLKHPETKAALERTYQKYKGKHVFVPSEVHGDACLDRARAFLFAHCLKDIDNYDYYWQLDGDLSWNWQDIDRLIEQDKDVIGALYPFKATETSAFYGQPVFKYINGERMDERTKLLKVHALAGGFIFAKISAFKKLIEDRGEQELVHTNPLYMDQTCNSYPTYMFWQPLREQNDAMGLGKMEYLSEDYALCKRFRDSGFEIYADLGIRLKHWRQNHYFDLRWLGDCVHTHVVNQGKRR